MCAMARAVSLGVIHCAAAFEMGIETGSKDDCQAAEEQEDDRAAEVGGVRCHRRISEGECPHFV